MRLIGPWDRLWDVSLWRGGGEVDMRPMGMADDYTIFICQVFRNSEGLNLPEP